MTVALDAMLLYTRLVPSPPALHLALFALAAGDDHRYRHLFLAKKLGEQLVVIPSRQRHSARAHAEK